jgi:hypothetical protein
MIFTRRIAAKIAVSFVLVHIGCAGAASWEISGTITSPSNWDAPEALRDLVGTSFTSVLSYNETVPPTSSLSPEFFNYANEGNITFNTLSGSAKANLQNLQTFIKETSDGRGSNFNGASFNVELTGPASFISLVPVSIDFQFQQTTWGGKTGLADFSLPSNLNIADFDEGGFVRLTFVSYSQQQPTISILGDITNVSPIPEPTVYAMFASGLLLLGWRARLKN